MVLLIGYTSKKSPFLELRLGTSAPPFLPMGSTGLYRITVKKKKFFFSLLLPLFPSWLRSGIAQKCGVGGRYSKPGLSRKSGGNPHGTLFGDLGADIPYAFVDLKTIILPINFFFFSSEKK